MKTSKIALLMCLIIPPFLFASCTNKKAYNELMEYVDPVNLPEQHETAYRYSEGLSSYRKGKLSGYIDKAGNIVIEPQYSYTGFFSDNLACVEKGGLYGFIDKTGNEVIPLQYKDAKDFVEGTACVYDGNKWFLIDKNGDTISNFDYSLTGQDNPIYIDGGYSTYQKGLLYGYVDQTGKLAIPAQFLKAGPMSNGHAFVIDREGRARIIEQTGKNVFPEWDIRKTDWRLENGLGLVIIEDGSKIGKSMVIDDKMNTIFEIPKEFGDHLYLSESLIHYQDPKTNKWGCLDVYCNVVIPPVLDNVGFSWDGVVMVFIDSDVPLYIKNPVFKTD